MQFNMSPQAWQSVSLLALALLVLAALVFDLRERRIPNQLVLVVLGAGLLINILGPQVDLRSAGLFTPSPGAIGFQGAALGALTGLALFLPFYILRAMGAGDVKLMAGIGSFVGAFTVVNLLVFILITGGALAIARMLWAGKSRLVMANVAIALGQMLPGSAGTFDPATQSADRMPYVVAIAGGLLAYGLWILSGRHPLISF
jgi:prepilin peptidase CpaA